MLRTKQPPCEGPQTSLILFSTRPSPHPPSRPFPPSDFEPGHATRNVQPGSHPRLPPSLPRAPPRGAVLRAGPVHGARPAPEGLPRARRGQGRGTRPGGGEAHDMVPQGGAEGGGDGAQDPEEPAHGGLASRERREEALEGGAGGAGEGA